MWHSEIWVDGKVEPKAEIVYFGNDAEVGFPYYEPGLTLEELDIVLNFIASLYPEGWLIKDGTIIDAKLGW